MIYLALIMIKIETYWNVNKGNEFGYTIGSYD